MGDSERKEKKATQTKKPKKPIFFIRFCKSDKSLN